MRVTSARGNFGGASTAGVYIFGGASTACDLCVYSCIFRQRQYRAYSCTVLGKLAVAPRVHAWSHHTRRSRGALLGLLCGVFGGLPRGTRGVRARVLNLGRRVAGHQSDDAIVGVHQRHVPAAVGRAR